MSKGKVGAWGRLRSALAPTAPVLVTAFIGLIGVMAAAHIASSSAASSDRRADRRIDRRTATQARGAARVLVAEFLQATAQIEVLRHDRILRPLTEGYPIEIPAQDLRLIASRLPRTEWGAVQDGLTNAEGLRILVSSQLASGRKRLRSGFENCIVSQDAVTTVMATQALSELADFDLGLGPLPPVPVCSP